MSSNPYLYGKNHNIGGSQNIRVQAVMLFKSLDWTMISILAFDWLFKYVHWKHLGTFSLLTVMVFAANIYCVAFNTLFNYVK